MQGESGIGTQVCGSPGDVLPPGQHGGRPVARVTRAVARTITCTRVQQSFSTLSLAWLGFPSAHELCTSFGNQSFAKRPGQELPETVSENRSNRWTNRELTFTDLFSMKQFLPASESEKLGFQLRAFVEEQSREVNYSGPHLRCGSRWREGDRETLRNHGHGGILVADPLNAV